MIRSATAAMLYKVARFLGGITRDISDDGPYGYGTVRAYWGRVLYNAEMWVSNTADRIERVAPDDMPF